MKNVLSILDIREKLEPLINHAINMKKDIKQGEIINHLKSKNMLMLFDRESTRTRCSFEIAMNKLGGNAIFINKNENNFDNFNDLEDFAKVLSRYIDVIVYRPVRKRNLFELAKYSTIPVINGLDENEHPCQILSDLMTITEYKGSLRGLNLIFVGDGGNNLAHTYILGGISCGMNVIIISPKKYWPIDFLKNNSRKISNREFNLISFTEDMNEIVDADIVATDTWISYWDDNQRQQRLEDFKHYTITDKIMKKTKKDTIFMHCMPIYYGEEVTKKVVQGEKSVIIDQAENRLYSEMALLTKLLI